MHDHLVALFSFLQAISAKNEELQKGIQVEKFFARFFEKNLTVMKTTSPNVSLLRRYVPEI